MKKYISSALIIVLLLSGIAISLYADSSLTQAQMTEAEAVKTRILLLEQALKPEDPFAAAKSWAEGVKTRNGALQFAVMSPELREKYYQKFVELGWVTGVSSPWVESYEITEICRKDNEIYKYQVVFTYTDSTQVRFTVKKHITVKNINDGWFVSAIEKAGDGN